MTPEDVERVTNGAWVYDPSEVVYSGPPERFAAFRFSGTGFVLEASRALLRVSPDDMLDSMDRMLLHRLEIAKL